MSSSSVSSSSAPSPSPPASPEASSHQYEPPSLERLVQHFVSSKRSLTSTNVVWRANELVNASRTLLEEIAVLNAKNVFTQRGVDEQIDTLHSIRDTVSDTAGEAGDEFRSTIDKLDLANERLEKTLRELRSTTVDAALSKPPHDTPEDDITDRAEDDDHDSPEQSPERNLYSFIDESRHESLRASLRGLIDSFNDARADFDRSIHRLDQSLTTITTTLASANAKESDGPNNRPTIYDEPPLTIAQLFRGMEEHAAEMATLLQSLVSHYDLCVTALKHTEGGAAAAKQAVQAADLSRGPTGSGTGEMEESLYRRSGSETSSATMDAAERTALLRVLEGDALEVADVVAELADRAQALEALFEQLGGRARRARGAHAALGEALAMLRDMRDVDLPAHLHALDTFRAAWQTIQTMIEGKTEEIVGLCDFNQSFLGDYERLLLEVERRKAAARQVGRVAEKANREIRRLEKADAEAREDFMLEVGKYLPNDLWPSMKVTLPRWTLHVDRDEGNVDP